MKLAAAISGDLRKIMAEEVKAAEDAVTAGMRQAADGLKADLRRQVTEAGMGQRLANTWRAELYPKGRKSIKAAGFVFTRAPTIIRAFDQGAVIKSKHGLWLAIPTPAAGTGARGKRMTPGLWEQMHGSRLRFIYRRGAPLRAWDDLCGDVHPGATGEFEEAPGRGWRRRAVGFGPAGADRQELAGIGSVTGGIPATL
ncbi:hypothetical protein MTBSS4_520003 [Magnetospirillum sp. SS-4]|nr:hypothetical protein MTBSS4_520003 [Magnetospirillum sp. SS-4]